MLDEPTNGLDPGEMREVRQLVHRVADAGRDGAVLEPRAGRGRADLHPCGRDGQGQARRDRVGRRPHRVRRARCTSRSTTSPAARRVLEQLPDGAAGRRRAARARGHHRTAAAVGPRRRAGAGGHRRRDGHRPAPARGRVPRTGGGSDGPPSPSSAPSSSKSTRRLAHLRRVRHRRRDPDHHDGRAQGEPARSSGRTAGAAACSSSPRSPGSDLPAVRAALTSEFLLVIIVALFGGDAMASDAAWGNLRYLLMRPVGRVRLLAAKFVVAVLCVGGGRSSSCSSRSSPEASCSAGIALDAPHSRTADLADPPVDRRHRSSTSASRPRTCRGCSPALVAFSFMLSCMTDSPVRRDPRRRRALHHARRSSTPSSRSVRSATCFPTHYFDCVARPLLRRDT